jgi:hypothetical protein
VKRTIDAISAWSKSRQRCIDVLILSILLSLLLIVSRRPLSVVVVGIIVVVHFGDIDGIGFGPRGGGGGFGPLLF